MGVALADVSAGQATDTYDEERERQLFEEALDRIDPDPELRALFQEHVSPEKLRKMLSFKWEKNRDVHGRVIGIDEMIEPCEDG